MQREDAAFRILSLHLYLYRNNVRRTLFPF